MQDHIRMKAGRVCAVAAFTLLLALFLAAKYDYYYDLNDDTMIKDILSGAYTGVPSGYSVQLLYPLSWFIALFYRAIPAVPWYGLFLCLCPFFVLAAIAWRLTGMAKSVWSGALLLAAEFLLALSLFLRELVIIQYSVTSGICMAGAVFLFMTSPAIHKPSAFLKKNLLPLALVLLSFMIRTEICMMLMPFLLFAGLIRWGSEEAVFTATNFRKYLMLIGLALLGMLAVYSLDAFAYRGSGWSSFRDFFKARTQVYDFCGLPAYDANRGFYESIGLSKESYALLENYNFALDDSIDTWSLEAIAGYQREKLHHTVGFASVNSVGQAVGMYRDYFVYNVFAPLLRMLSGRRGQLGTMRTSAVAGLAALAAYLAYIAKLALAAGQAGRRAGGVKIALLWVIRSMIWLYLYMVDRAPERVTVPLLMVELALLCCFMLIGEKNGAAGRAERYAGKRGRIFGVTAAALFGLCVSFSLFANIRNVDGEFADRAAADARWDALMDYCVKNGKNYYVIDVYSSTSYEGTPYSEKVFKNVDNSYKNFDICGGWAAKSPLAQEKMEKRGIKNIQRALLGTEKGGAGTYFITKPGNSLEWLEIYYGKRGVPVRAVCKDKIFAGAPEAAFEVYSLERVPK